MKYNIHDVATYMFTVTQSIFPPLWVWSVEMEIIDYKLNESHISLHNCCYSVCELTCTSSVEARWMSAPAWTSRSTTSVWPFSLAAYTGLKPFCVSQQQRIV